MTDGFTFRRPMEADYPAISRVIDDWWGERKMDVLLPRLWLQHFTGTSWLAEAADGGRRRVVAVTWPANHASLAFHRALGFEIQSGPGSQKLYGTTAQAGYDFDREDRAILVRAV